MQYIDTTEIFGTNKYINETRISRDFASPLETVEITQIIPHHRIRNVLKKYQQAKKKKKIQQHLSTF